MRHPRPTTNRTLLALSGLVLLGFGGTALLGGLDLARQWHFPDAWPWTRPHQVLVPAADRTRWSDESWWWPVVIAFLVLVWLLALWWLIAQLRSRRLHHILVDTHDGESAQLRGRALEQALATDAASLPGVDHVTTRLTGRRTRPRARLTLRLAAHADPSDALRRLAQEALPHAGQAAGTERLPAKIRLRATRHRAERVQ
jgi:hypothetical protein